jgi:ribosomal protein S18 acetylase RimI-like enzyme
VVEPGVGLAAQREAAGVWARATAVRDGLPSVPSLADKLVGVQQALGEAGASLLVARRGATIVGFCVLVPQGDVLEVRYLAADPSAWGSGVAPALLDGVGSRARAGSFERGELWVIADNARAIALYERSFWVGTERIEVRGSAGRPERLFTRRFA